MNSRKSWRSVEQRREGEVREVDNMTREGERGRGKMNLPAGYWKYSGAVRHGGHLEATPLL